MQFQSHEYDFKTEDAYCYMQLIYYLKLPDWIDLINFVETSYLKTYVQIWIIAKSWKQSPVTWYLESLQQT